MTRLEATADAKSTATHRSGDLELQLERHRAELTAYCYRMLGSAFEAEDAVQETLVRAWRGFDRFEGRSAFRSWLYQIATNVCLDMLNGRERRARPMDLGPAGTADVPAGATLPEATWIQPIPDNRVLPPDGDPAELAVARDTIRLAFVAALQHLPPRQRAVLILRDVLRWKAAEVAELLDTSVASVNSALQRAHATLAATDLNPSEPLEPMDEEQRSLLQRYVEAFEHYDMDSLTSLLHEDATQTMPPYELWLRGRDDILRWWFGPGAGCRGSRLVPTVANGLPAFGQYRPSGPGGSFEPWALQVIELSGGRIVGFNAFLDTATLFPLFGLRPRPPEPKPGARRDDLGQPDESEELLQLGRGVTQSNLTPQPSSGELHPGERVYGADVGIDQRTQVADDHLGTALAQQDADALAEARCIRASDRAVDDQDGRERLRKRSQ